MLDLYARCRRNVKSNTKPCNTRRDSSRQPRLGEG